MERFKERQISWLIIICCIATTYLMINLINTYIYQIGTNPLPLPVFLILLLILLPILFILMLFYKMTTVVFDDRIEIKYGFGVVKRTFRLKDLRAGDLKKIPWYYGAGIKYYSFSLAIIGTLYSINFTDAVEFRFKYKNKAISIGTKTPQLLMDSANKALEDCNSNSY